MLRKWEATSYYNAIRPHESLGYKPPAPEVFVPAFDAHVYVRVQNFLCRRHNVSRRGTSRFSFGDVFGELTVSHLMEVVV